MRYKLNGGIRARELRMILVATCIGLKGPGRFILMGPSWRVTEQLQMIRRGV